MRNGLYDGVEAVPGIKGRRGCFEDYDDDMPRGPGGYPILDRDKAVWGGAPIVDVTVKHIYLVDEIEEPFNYVEIIRQLNTAAPTDQFIFHINCVGGDLWTTTQLVHAMQTTQGVCLASIEGLCCSAATMIALACDSWQMSPFGAFMIHAPTLGSFGKFDEIKASQDFNDKWTENLFKKVYEGFLSTDEIARCLHQSKDLWFDCEEAIDRFKKVLKFRQEKAEAAKATKAEGKPAADPKPKKTAKKTKIQEAREAVEKQKELAAKGEMINSDEGL